jgi:hypothetical protein
MFLATTGARNIPALTLFVAAVVPAAIALAVWLYELAFVSRKTLSASRIRYPARSDHRRRKLED